MMPANCFKNDHEAGASDCIYFCLATPLRTFKFAFLAERLKSFAKRLGNNLEFFVFRRMPLSMDLDKLCGHS